MWRSNRLTTSCNKKKNKMYRHKDYILFFWGVEANSHIQSNSDICWWREKARERIKGGWKTDWGSGRMWQRRMTERGEQTWLWIYGIWKMLKNKKSASPNQTRKGKRNFSFLNNIHKKKENGGRLKKYENKTNKWNETLKI